MKQSSGLRKTLKRLRDEGHDELAIRLEALIPGVEALLSSERLWTRTRRKAANTFRRQGSRVLQEARETLHLASVGKRLLDGTPVSSQDRRLAREQLLDLLKTFPASAVLVGTFLIPLPGAQPILAPILMEKLGLLPSAWLEERVDEELLDLIEGARRKGLLLVVEKLEELKQQIARHSLRRERVWSFIKENPQWEVLFDENLDQTISDDEVSTIVRDLEGLVDQVQARGEEQCWYLFVGEPPPSLLRRKNHDADEEAIVGPLPFDEVRRKSQTEPNALIRCGADGAWVPLSVVLHEVDGS